MIRLKKIMSKKKRITTIRIASAVAVAAIILIGYYYPALYDTVIDASSNVFDCLSKICSAL